MVAKHVRGHEIISFLLNDTTQDFVNERKESITVTIKPNTIFVRYGSDPNHEFPGLETETERVYLANDEILIHIGPDLPISR